MSLNVSQPVQIKTELVYLFNGQQFRLSYEALVCGFETIKYKYAELIPLTFLVGENQGELHIEDYLITKLFSTSVSKCTIDDSSFSIIYDEDKMGAGALTLDKDMMFIDQSKGVAGLFQVVVQGSTIGGVVASQIFQIKLVQYINQPPEIEGIENESSIDVPIVGHSAPTWE